MRQNAQFQVIKIWQSDKHLESGGVGVESDLYLDATGTHTANSGV